MQPASGKRRAHLVLAATVCALALAGCLPPLRVAVRLCRPAALHDVTRAQLQALDCLITLSRGAPHSRPLARRVEEGFREAYRALLKRPLRDAELGLWLELYRLSTRFYPRETKLPGKDGVPMTFVNSHHFSVPFWVKRSLEIPLGTLLHFDTHADMDGVPRMDDVRRAVRSIRAGRDLRRSWHVLAHAIHRNGMPVTGAVLAAGVREIVWIKPLWARDVPEVFGRAFFYARPRGALDPRPLDPLPGRGWVRAFVGQASDLFQLYYDPADNQGSHLPEREGAVVAWTTVTARQRPHARHFERATSVRMSILNEHVSDRDVSRLVELTAKRFVLDVDLDYFVNTGFTAEGGDNPPSFGQPALEERSGDTHLEEFRYRRMRELGIAEERKVIAERVERFTELLHRLRAAGRRPTIVSIADSTNIPFTSRREGEEQDVFVPSHHTYWVRERVTTAIREVFGETPSSARRPGRPPSRLATRAPPPRPHLAVALQERIRRALWRAVVWAVASSHGIDPSPLHLWLLYAVARSGPTSALRHAASTAAVLSARHAIKPVGRRLGASATADEVLAALHRFLLGAAIGSADARIELAGARWLAGEVGVRVEPDLAADTRPISPARLRALVGGPPRTNADLAALLASEQTPDGGFGAESLARSPRATFSLLVTRGLLGLLPPASERKPDTRLVWPGHPIRRGEAEDALLRGLLSVMAQLVRYGGSDRTELGLELLRPFARIGTRGTIRALTRAAGRALALAWEPPAQSPIRTRAELVRLAALAEAVTLFGGNATSLTGRLKQRVGRAFPAPTAPPDAATAASPEGIERRQHRLTLARLGLGNGSPPASLAPTYPGPKAPAPQLTQCVVAVAGLLLEARMARSPRPDEHRAERRLLEDSLPAVRASLRPEVVSAWVLSRGALAGRPGTAYRDLVWLLLHMQNRDGSWGAERGTREALVTTARAALALATSPTTCRNCNLARAGIGPTLPSVPTPRARR